MASDALYLALAQALSQPSRAYRSAQAGLGIPGQALQGYLTGTEISDKLRQRKLAQQTLFEALGGNVPEGLGGFSRTPISTLTSLAPGITAAASLAKATETK